MTVMTLSDRFMSQSDNLTLKRVMMVIIGVCALTISAKVQVPFGIIPGTFQVLVLMVISAAYGARMAGLTVGSYLAMGLMGLPVFALGAGAGPLYFAGPTGGYLIGFFVAALAVGALAEKGWDRGYLTMFLAMVIGLLIVHAFGSAWLYNLFGAQIALDTFTGFVFFDFAKLLVAIILFPTIWKMVGDAR